MGSQHTVIDDMVYNLISIEYHALQGAETYAKYLEDAKAQGTRTWPSSSARSTRRTTGGRCAPTS